MKKLFFLICFSFFGFSQLLPLNAATFHAILIGDTKNDYLNKLIKKDIKHMEEHFDDLFDALDVESFEQTTYTGKSVNEEILGDFNDLKIASDDVVFLYFSGHGYHTGKADEGQWPYLYFSHVDLGIHQQRIVQTLLEHQPRLLICFVDCCSNVIEEDNYPKRIIHEVKTVRRVKSQYPRVNAHIRSLFQQRGVIVISSASEGYYSEGTDEEGSCFTNCYIKLFNKMAQKGEMSWDLLLSKAQQMLWKEQRPQYELLLGDSSKGQ